MIVSLSLQFCSSPPLLYLTALYLLFSRVAGHLISTDDETKLGSSLTVLGHLGGKPIPGIANPDISTPIR